MVLAIASLGWAQNAELDVEVITVCAGVEGRSPVGPQTEFENTVGSVFCFTKITGAADPTTVGHVWYYNDKEMARVELSVNSAAWRTWSSKRILADWTGVWRVDVESSDGTVLKSTGFTVKPAAE
jgi:hypothetical protein